MNREQAEKLARIYNTLMLVKTSGQDTKIMGKCLEQLGAFLQQVTIVEDNIVDQNKEG